MRAVEILLLGPFRVLRDGQPVADWGTDAVRALLAYLAVHAGSPCRREELAGLLWPEEPEATARHNLRQALSHLRKTVEDRPAVEERDQVDTQVYPYLTVTREAIALAPEAGCEVDVAAFAEAIAATRAHAHRRLEACAVCIARLRQAVELYRGEFMAGFSLPSALFEEWLLAEREGLRLHVLDALDALAAYHERRGENEPALRYARRQLELEPWCEAAHRQCMRALALRGERGAALAQYEACRRALAQELGVEPEPETTALYERIHGATAEPVTSAVARHNLPAQLTPFVGREQALDEIARWMGDPTCRLLTLVGPGGSGKTRLALEAAAEQVYAFAHGVFFVSLAPVASPEGIVPAIAQALGLTFYPGEEPRRQLVSYLRTKEQLLVLDNLEHLIEGMGLLAELLSAAPDLRILATSRARLSLQGEQILPVEGMDYPTSPHPPSPLSSPDGRGEGARGSGEVTLRYSAVTLFLPAARRVRPGYEPSADDLGQVARICRLVEGMPLAILLAAAWADVLPVSEIAAYVAQGPRAEASGRSLGFLEAELHDLPERQRSMRAVFDASWRLLSEQERAVFAALTTFHGGFTAVAAQAVAGADLRTLSGLVRKSFLQVESGGRYQVHELLRQYAQGELHESPAVEQQVRNRHGAYYAAMAQQWGEQRHVANREDVVPEMRAEIDNVRAAWTWAVDQPHAEHLARMTEGMHILFEWVTLWWEAEAAFSLAAERMSAAIAAPAASSTPRDGRLLAMTTLAGLLVGLADFEAVLGRLDAADRLYAQCQALLERPELAGHDLRAQRAQLLYSMGGRLLETDFQASRRLYEESAALFRDLGSPEAASSSLYLLAVSSWLQTDFRGARRLCEEVLALGRSGIPRAGHDALWLLSLVAACQGDVATAEKLAAEAYGPSWDQGVQGHDLWDLWGRSHLLASVGRYAAAEQTLEEMAAQCRQSGNYVYLMRCLSWLMWVKTNLGQYEQACALAEEERTLADQWGSRLMVAVGMGCLGSLALVEGRYAEAQQLLEETSALCQQSDSREQRAMALGVMGQVVRRLGESERAWACVREALPLAVEMESFDVGARALSAIALLLADRGEGERAAELWALLWRYPIVAHSRWYEDIAGRELAAVAAALPPEVAAAAQARGRARDLWATARELLDEFG